MSENTLNNVEATEQFHEACKILEDAVLMYNYFVDLVLAKEGDSADFTHIPYRPHEIESAVSKILYKLD